MIRRGMTLFELLVVMIVVGIVYSVGLFTMKKSTLASSTLTLSQLKTSMNALEHDGAIRMICDPRCRECRVVTGDGTRISRMQLQSDGTVQRYEIDRYGELKKTTLTIARTGEGLEEVCFEFTLNPDGTSTPLILKDNASFYVYSPLVDETPYQTDDPDAVRRYLYGERHYPMKEDDTYAAHAN